MIMLAMLLVRVGLQGLLAFSTVAQGPMGHIMQPREVVIRTAEAWEKLWPANRPQRPRSAVDFSQSLIVGVFLGARPTAGYSVEIIRVHRQGDTAVVEYVERRPAPGLFVAQVVTSPFHLASLARDVDVIEFRQIDAPG